MTAVGELLDAARERTGIPSDNALAARLGIQRQLLSKARAGEKPISDERIAQICALAKLDGPTWIAMIHAERATTATERALWRLMLDRMGAAAAVVALVALSMPGLANAKTAQNQAVSGGLLTHSVYYVTKGSAHTNPSQSSPGRKLPPLQVPPTPAEPGSTAPTSHPACRHAGVGSTHHLRTGLAMRLADFIERNAREILEDAVAFAETQAPDTVEFSAKQLRNHLPQILQAVVDDLRSPQTASQQLAKSHGLAPLKPGPESAASYHGRTRAIAGFGLN
ncbi:TPA: DUF3693 domain-containing protein [Stenotrophomonas maltophilia]